jgi:hypothetical protein
VSRPRFGCYSPVHSGSSYIEVAEGSAGQAKVAGKVDGLLLRWFDGEPVGRFVAGSLSEISAASD